MLIGQSVLAPTSPGAVYFSPWVPRLADAFTAVVEVIQCSASASTSLSCVVETKNNEDSDAALSTLATFSVTTTAGAVTPQLCTGSKELVRYKFTATGTSTTRWIHFRSDAMIWQPN